MNPLIHLRNAQIQPFTTAFIKSTRVVSLVCKVLERTGYVRSFNKDLDSRQIRITFTRILDRSTKLNHLHIFNPSRSSQEIFVTYTDLLKLTKFTRGVFILSNSELGVCSHEELLSIFQGGVLIGYIE